MIEIFITLIIPVIGTTLGAAMVFLIKDRVPPLFEKVLLGFASGVMIAAAVWSLLIPSMEINPCNSIPLPTVIGFLFGMCFLLLLDDLVPHQHVNETESEGLKSNFSKTTKLALAVTLHNIPEGMAVGVALASTFPLNLSLSIPLTIGIAIQNIPEGAIVSMPLRTAGNSKWKSFGIGTASGIVEPIAAIVTIWLASSISSILPYLLAFAAGAMLYVVVEELIPEASKGKHSNLSTIGFAVGFTLMMILDVVLG
ncbi:MAG: ZIP family metal transporter [Muribaculaceae bacterium]